MDVISAPDQLRQVRATGTWVDVRPNWKEQPGMPTKLWFYLCTRDSQITRPRALPITATGGVAFAPVT
jgi:hypothetical protein